MLSAVRLVEGRVLAIAMVAMTLAAACSGKSTPAQPASTTTIAPSPPTPTASPSPSSQATDAVLAAYEGFRRAQVKAESKADTRGSGIEEYAVDKALADVNATVLLFQQQGIVVRGRPVSNATVTSIELTPTPHAVISDCFDTSKWEAVYKATGKSAVAPGQARRTVVEAALEEFHGRWLVRTLTDERDRTC